MIFPSDFRPLSEFELQKYLVRIKLDQANLSQPTLKTLNAVLGGHAKHIPWENSTLFFLHKPIELDVGAIFEALVMKKRGTYCYGNNILLYSALTALGFKCTTGIARLLRWDEIRGGHEAAHSLHMIVFVAVAFDEGRAEYLADMDFNRVSVALRIADGEHVSCAAGEVFELRKSREFAAESESAAEFSLWYQRAGTATPKAFYSFTLDHMRAKDYEVINYFVGNNREQELHQVFLVSRDSESNGRVVLINTKLVRKEAVPEFAHLEKAVHIASVEDLVAALEGEFGIALSTQEQEAAATLLFSKLQQPIENE
ncbi:hypothetical protein HK100_005420 [Physocladia obscura]|uniref:Arylamine N-acetyltransferase n=1 Tax=Physocladia obscura TaxID=109957 RepID=A0AAD5XCB5_9FUNG|nr:hypothetical protein HK100_005420 [Physocladia obscura]